ncbi:hypothetical protein GGD81_002677 [Rhodobium orientis]|uniref:Uncharacterized protein n=1 Tax=Rhodobium orientis TaxID=34017 RepID=A0A327JLY1_9HYPH|nr:hypothetical protein [Rhodobium orientis]MBB4303630.1 hypothetical protein [Rhodobium orientis]MBK5951914.1 hypothetical protein [Rhodobium orientis]RAI26765.1 hypothetical protein CH339_12765 [Rhodobium orientis]
MAVLAAAAISVGLSGVFAGVAVAATDRYAKVEGWTIVAVSRDGGFRSCRAALRGRGGRLGLTYTGRAWIVSVPGDGRIGKFDGNLTVDDMSDAFRFRSGNGKRASARVRPHVIDGIRAGRRLSATLNAGEMAWSLGGSAAALSAVEECFARKGRAAPVAQRPAAPAKRRTAGACPRGEKPLPVTGLCPAEAREAFLSMDDPEDYRLEPGCRWVVNETPFAGRDEAVMYLATECKGRTAKLDFSADNRGFRMNSSAGDVKITGITVDAADPEKSVQRFARQAIEDKRRRRDCTLQMDDDGERYNLDLPPAEVARLSAEGPYGWECGPYGTRDDASHWRIFGGYGWHFEVGQDAYASVSPESVRLLHHVNDGNSDSLDGWRIQYGDR